jgi:hypothetical protein
MNEKPLMWCLTARALSPGTEVFVNRRTAWPKYPECACIARNAGISVSGVRQGRLGYLCRKLLVRHLVGGREFSHRAWCLSCSPLRAASAAILTDYLKHPLPAMGCVP